MVGRSHLGSSASKEWHACLLMRNADPLKHDSMTKTLKMSQSLGNNRCPKTLTKATKILLAWHTNGTSNAI